MPNNSIINGTLATVNAFEVYLQILCKSSRFEDTAGLCRRNLSPRRTSTYGET
ncbi:hypothetical protein CA54_58520 [Symmachiella macrocystis]|uniref:Uncharacterized protein n=1 Tax=Symmachiella macrocystis TaxID=2527985 RepID=A0A5C6B3U2_9PLAN|nr:hypothetical protein CA54_58520 [Symmachiella macrocystis]